MEAKTDAELTQNPRDFKRQTNRLSDLADFDVLNARSNVRNKC